MARDSQRPLEVPDIRVKIRNVHGKYLAQDDHGLYFTEERTVGMVFNYRSDCVADQLRMLQEVHGIALAAEPVPAEEIYEVCDRCQDLFMPFMTFFDGKQFLCADCRRRGPKRPPRP